MREQLKFEAFYNKDNTTINFSNQCNTVLLKKLKGPIFKLPIKIVHSNNGTILYPLAQFTHPLYTCVPINPIESEECSLDDSEISQNE